MTTTISVSGRIATVTSTDRLVAGNTYPVMLALDSEWTGSLFMRVRFGSQYYDIPFASSDTSVNVQFPVGYPEAGLGVFSEALEICSNEVRVRLLRSILEQGVSVVDFDSDLYDQWAGEVSELLCDDDFDAESQRPVKNSVLTAWKNTVPLDSALVHKAGTETITGVKTFTSNPIISRTSPNITFRSSYLNTSLNTYKGVITVTDVKDGANSTQMLMYCESTTNYESLNLRMYKPNRSGYYNLNVRSYADHGLIVADPYYPVDSGGNPIPLTAGAVMLSGNVAVDPRIVHTTGTETIAGDKTFTGMPTVSGTQATLDMASTTSASTVGWKAQFRYRDQSSLVASTIVMTGEDSTQVETRVYKPDRSNYYWMRHTAYSDHELLTVQPYYPVDGSGNPQPLTAGALVSSGNIAVDPRIVHTTGNETVAGDKNFTGITSIDNPRFKRVDTVMPSNVWKRFYTFVPQSYGGFVVARFYDTYYIYGYVGAEVRIRQGNPTSNPDGKLYNVGTNIRLKMAKRSADGVVEVWLCQTSSGSKGIRMEIVEEAGGSVTPALMEGSMPEVGDTYSIVVDAEVVS